MSVQAEQLLLKKLRALPPQQRAEVEDFGDFLPTRRERARDHAAQCHGESFAKLDALNLPPVSPEDVQAEIDAVRATGRDRDADRR